MMPALTLDACWQATRQRLRAAGCVEYALEARLLLCHALQIPPTTLLAHGERPVAASSLARLETLLAARCTGQPMAYLLGEREFWSLPLAVDARCLIPRPATETLVVRALKHLPPSGSLSFPDPALPPPTSPSPGFSSPAPPPLDLFPPGGSEPASSVAPVRVLDLGTGSGAILLALLSERPQIEGWANDRHAEALSVARANARQLHLPIVAFQGHWLQAIRSAPIFTLIVANPPYIDPEDPCLQHGDLRYEPRTALVAARHGLADLQEIIAEALPRVRPGGWLLLEHGATHGPAVRQEMLRHGWQHIGSFPDDEGHERVTEGQRPARLPDAAPSRRNAPATPPAEVTGSKVKSDASGTQRG